LIKGKRYIAWFYITYIGTPYNYNEMKSWKVDRRPALPETEHLI